MDYTIFQGGTSYIDAKTLSSTFVMSDGYNKYTSDVIVNRDDGLKIELAPSMTSGFLPGTYSYQVVNEEGLESQGRCKVKANLIYADSVESYWRQVIKAIDEKLAGRASEAAMSIHVGDKGINYMSNDELIKLRAFAEQRLSEEDEDTYSPNNEKQILHHWRLR